VWRTFNLDHRFRPRIARFETYVSKVLFGIHSLITSTLSCFALLLNPSLPLQFFVRVFTYPHCPEPDSIASPAYGIEWYRNHIFGLPTASKNRKMERHGYFMSTGQNKKLLCSVAVGSRAADE